MFDVASWHVRIFQRSIWIWKYRIQMHLERFHRAWRYALGALSADEAQTIIVECKHPAGWYPLMILAVDDVLERALAEFAEYPALRGFIDEGCYKVYRKWETYGDELEEAIRWAIEVAEDYAVNEGIRLVRISNEASSEDGEGEQT